MVPNLVRLMAVTVDCSSRTSSASEKNLSVKNCELSIRKKELGGKITIDIICMTKFGEMSVAQYREFFCGVGRDWEEEDPEDDR